jgi:hypothetical protein
MKSRDEDYVINICDRLLRLKAQRQSRFDLLRGDPGRNGSVGRRLPVDAYYPELNLVIEYRERQHSEPVTFFDKPERLTCSGCTRGEQRKRYDQLRRDVLKQHGIRLLELDYSQLSCNRQGRLRRDEAVDEAVIRHQLSEYLQRASTSV